MQPAPRHGVPRTGRPGAARHAVQHYDGAHETHHREHLEQALEGTPAITHCGNERRVQKDDQGAGRIEVNVGNEVNVGRNILSVNYKVLHSMLIFRIFFALNASN